MLCLIQEPKWKSGVSWIIGIIGELSGETKVTLRVRRLENREKWGIYFTQVTPRCSIAFHGGLSAKSDRIRSPLLHREGMPGVFGPASVAGWFSLSTMRGAEGVVGE